MKKFLVLYLAPVGTFDEMMKNASPEEQKQGMDNWLAWGKKHEAEIVDFGAPAGKNKRVTADGAVDQRNEIGGYSIIRAESHDAAVAIMADSPHLAHPGASIDVVALLDM